MIINRVWRKKGTRVSIIDISLRHFSRDMDQKNVKNMTVKLRLIFLGEDRKPPLITGRDAWTGVWSTTRITRSILIMKEAFVFWMPRRKVTNRTYSTQTCLFLENHLIVKKLVEPQKERRTILLKFLLQVIFFF